MMEKGVRVRILVSGNGRRAEMIGDRVEAGLAPRAAGFGWSNDWKLPLPQPLIFILALNQTSSHRILTDVLRFLSQTNV